MPGGFANNASRHSLREPLQGIIDADHGRKRGGRGRKLGFGALEALVQRGRQQSLPDGIEEVGNLALQFLSALYDRTDPLLAQSTARFARAGYFLHFERFRTAWPV